MVTKRRLQGLGCLTVPVLVIAFVVWFVRFGPPLDNVPTEDEMPRATDLPLPEGLELVDGYCSGGSAGCYKGVQTFRLRTIDENGGSPFHCDELKRHLESQGWKVSVVESGLPVYLKPDGTLTAKCEDITIKDERFTNVTMTWPGRIEFKPFDDP